MATIQYGGVQGFKPSSLSAPSPVGSLAIADFNRNNPVQLFGTAQQTSPAVNWNFSSSNPQAGVTVPRFESYSTPATTASSAVGAASGNTLFGGNGGFGGLSYGNWAMMGLKAVGDLMNAYSSYSQAKTMKKSFKHQKAMDLQNMRNAVQDYNRRLEERYTTAYTGRGDMSEDEAKRKAREYREANSLKSL